MILFWGWGLCQGNKVEFCFSRNYLFGGVGWCGWRKGVGIFFSLFLSFIIR